MTNAKIKGTYIKIFNEGRMMRDFTFIDDITTSIKLLLGKPPAAKDLGDALVNLSPAESYAPYHLFNIGNNQPVSLLDFVEILEGLIGKKATKEFLPMQKGDMEKTYADIDDLSNTIGYKPHTDIKDGLTEFVNWYRSYYQ